MSVRDARAEAAARVGGRFDVRVLEPSPPAIDEPPFFADDPVDGGDVVPVDRPDARTWAALCDEEGDDDLRAWCAERWLVRGHLRPLATNFRTTREALHTLAEHVVAPIRHRANGKIGLRFTFHGFGTPFFRWDGRDRQVRVEDGALVDNDRRAELSTLRDAAAFLEIQPGAPREVYEPATPFEPDARLEIDTDAARAVGDWYGFAGSVLEQLRADAYADDAPGRVQLWPEHFDMGVDLGPTGSRANYGASPGDGEHDDPYLYVGPWDLREGDFWNEPFGASLSYTAILGGEDPLAFLRRGRELLRA